ncbi:hypothetical protein SFC50_22990 [Bacillus infantis]|uniref:hypothetical protein n=1 Tax=Bacillus infantis TaxID=324767 RepID=UPI0039825EA6
MEEGKSCLQDAGRQRKQKAQTGMLAFPKEKAAGSSSCGFSSIILLRPVLLRP